MTYYDYRLAITSYLWHLDQDNDTHGDDKVTIINPNQLPPAIVDSWKGPLPGPLTVALDYIKREFDDGLLLLDHRYGQRRHLLRRQA